MPDALDHLKVLEQGATPGPWEWLHEIGLDHSDVNTIVREPTDLEKHGKPWLDKIAIAGSPVYRNEDAALIAAARNSLPILIEIAEAARRYRGARRRYVVQWAGHIPRYTEREKAGIDLDAAIAGLDALDA